MALLMALTSTNSTAATIRKLMRAVIRSPTRIGVLRMENFTLLKSALPKTAEMTCIRTPLERAVTTALNAAPMMNPMARSSMLPLKANSLNSLMTPFICPPFSSEIPQLVRQAPQGLASVADRVLLVRRELRHRPGFTLGDEPGVVAEAARPPGLEPDPAPTRAAPAALPPFPRPQPRDAPA